MSIVYLDNMIWEFGFGWLKSKWICKICLIKKKIKQAESSYGKLNQTLPIKGEDDAAELISSRGRRDFSLLSSEIKQCLSLEISYKNTKRRWSCRTDAVKREKIFQFALY